ncbi:cobalt ECF transporter T component CbiQ [Pleomorphomonas diazotrophica]|uniref:Cobalt ECF transporter T component CbiQ n=1 Tax=Pleomorphomonas diazotrophica TaxID=1166257 RepID=A0A1I4WM18_9HYPH|nr:cobalt ECF transporter T component CbiQ [Pleomorphomonas diazotrophica]PKR91033.1 cobalt ECF transporter T component CbiQ [Pleomorphomonas diazotrophica]SFN14019.1 cobalt/nickel transport system permease protein [Pleomorphomonas diazotrophica]
MATDVTYAEAPVSPLDRLDTRTRIVVAVALVLALVSLRSWMLLGTAILLGLALTMLAGVSPRQTVRRLLHVEGFLLILFVALPLLTSLPPFIEVGPLSLSVPGLERAVTLVLRISAAALVVLPLVSGLTPIRLGHALGRFGLPARLVQVFLFSIRYIELLRAEARRLHDAMRLRGFRPATNLHTLKSYGHFIGQLLVRAVERAERVDEAMRCRGFAGRFPLVTLERLGLVDFVAAALTALLVSTALLMDRL